MMDETTTVASRATHDPEATDSAADSTAGSAGESAARSTDESTGESAAETRTRCPECDGRLVADEARGERACRDCGLVVDDAVVDRGPEWRSFDDDGESRRRVGAPVTERRHDNGLSTTISWRDEDAYGNRLSAERREQFRRLRTWDRRFATKDARERNLRHAFGEIDRMASALGIAKPSRETACVVYRQAVERELLPGRTIEGMATASLYVAARRHGTPRTLVEFETVSRVEKLRIQRAYRYLSRELGLQLEPTDPLEYVPQITSELPVSDETERLARELVDAATDAALHSGRMPISIAAAATYAAAQLANDGVTQAEVADASHVSKVTIRSRYTEILEAYEERADR